GLTQSDIQMESIGFTQVASLSAGQVEAAMVYAANEPIQLQSQGLQVSTVKVADYIQLASNGLATNDKTLQQNPDLVAKVVRATLRGIQVTIAYPSAAFTETLKQVPQAGGANRDLQFKILHETVKLMQPNPNDPTAKAPLSPGWTDEVVWQATE